MSLVPSEHSGAASRLVGVRLSSVNWSDVSGWSDDDHHAALLALGRTARFVEANGAHRSGALGVSGAAMMPVLARSRVALNATERNANPRSVARHFFEEEFQPWRIERDAMTGASEAAHGTQTGLGGRDGEGFVTGFYEPFVEAVPTASADYRFPIHAPPSNLVKVGDGTGPQGYAWAMRGTDGSLHEAPDRKAIEHATIGVEVPPAPFSDWPVVAWARDRVDLFFAHVQGAARLVFADGTTKRITFAAKSGHPFTGIGGELVRAGELSASDVSMDTIREWLARHPVRVEALLQHNRSYIFFRTAPVDDPSLGPIAAARVPLTPGRSLAVDRLLHTFGTPIHVHAPTLADPESGAEFARLMIAQETGTAIRGAARGDIFTGSGEDAGRVAGRIANAARFTLLAPRGTAPSPLRH